MIGISKYSDLFSKKHIESSKINKLNEMKAVIAFVTFVSLNFVSLNVYFLSLHSLSQQFWVTQNYLYYRWNMLC